MPLPVTRRQWDIVFLLLLPVIAFSAGIGHYFGAPLNNLIVLCWLPPAWLLARMRARKSPAETGLAA